MGSSALKSAKDKLEELGYEPSKFNASEFMNAAIGFFKHPDDVLKIREGYFGDFHGRVREVGFVADYDNKYRHLISEVMSANSSFYSENPNDYTKEKAVSLLSDKFGEDAICCILKLYDPQTYNLVYHMAVDIQYAENAIFLFSMKQYKIQKRRKQDVRYWEIRLL